MMEDEILANFLEEAREFMASIEDDLLRMESGFDRDVVNNIFRAVHTVKGGAGFLGLDRIGGLAHAMEDVLSRIRNKELAPNPQIVSTLLRGVDLLNRMLNSDDQGKSADSEAVASEVRGLLVPPPAEKNARAPEEDASKPALPPEVLEKADRSKKVFRVELDFRAIRKGINLKDQPGGLLGLVRNAGTILHCDIPEDKINTRKAGKSVLYLQTIHDGEIVAGVLGLSEEAVSLADLPAEEAAETRKPETETADKPEAKEASPALPKKPAPSSKTSSESVRVKVDLLDRLMTIAGEIVLSRNQLVRRFASTRDNALMISHSRQVTQLQESIMKTRLQPVGIVIGKFKRIVRDMASKLGKEIDLTLEGEDVELDRSIIEGLSDPLTHLIRNCADHALEPPEERERAGKPRAGHIRLSATHEGGYVIIQIEDDGRGIDPGKIRKKALEKDMITEEEAGRMTDQEMVSLIFRPGFSTVEKVSDISGRGVGMDVVKTSFERLGGSVNLETEPGKGTCVKVQLPLTLSIIPSLVVAAEDNRFAIPQVDVVEIVRIREGDGEKRIEHVQGQAVFRLRGKLLPVVRLADTLGIGRTFTDPATGNAVRDQRQRIGDRRDVLSMPEDEQRKNPMGRRKAEIQRLMVLRFGQNFFGLLVDAVLDPEEVVVKPLPACLKSCRAFSSTTIMGDGSVSMILDVGGMVGISKFKFDSLERKMTEFEEEAKRRSLLEKQIILIFTNAADEYFSIPIAMASRVEKISREAVEHVGEKEFVQLRGRSVRILRLEECIEVKPGDRDRDDFYLIIPQIIESPLGIWASTIVDVLETVVIVDTESVSSPGLMGSCIIDKRMTLMLDMYALLELAEPEGREDKKVEGPEPGECRVLLVEDTPFFRSLEKKYFEDAGFEVRTACDGREALDLLREAPDGYDIVVTDIEMPVMDGFELLKSIKTDKGMSHLPVMALTALSSQENRAAGRQAGFDAYEVKIDREKLVRRVREMVGWSREGKTASAQGAP